MNIDLLATTSTNERWLILANLIREIGMQATYYMGIFGYAAFGFGGNPHIIAAVMLVFNISHMIGSVAAGIVIDRIGPRRTVLVSSLLVIATCLVFFVVDSHLPTFLLLTAVFGVVTTVLNMAYLSFAPYLERTKMGLRRVNSFLTVGTFIAAVIGPALGAVVIGSFSVYSVFILMAIATAIGTGITLVVREIYQPISTDNTTEKTSPLREALEGWRIIKQSRTLRFYLIAAIAMVFGFGAFDALEPLYFKEVLAVELSTMGWIQAIGGIGLIAGVIALALVSADKVNARLLAVLVPLCGIGTVIYVGTHNLLWVVVGQLMLGAAFGVFDPLLRTLVQADSPLEVAGRVLGTINMIIVGLLLVPLLVAPSLSNLIGVQPVLVSAGALTLALGILLYPAGKKLDAKVAESRSNMKVDIFADE
ncbi:MAG: MFS transporter [Coriobacteriia bacterium]|nr:MFS transporter [Coriobacteriia bacterium]